jgi:hypothetical protein
LSLLLNRETCARLGLPGEKTKKNKNKKRRRRRTTKEGGAALGQADQPLYEVHLSLHKQVDAASLERLMTVFSEPQSFLIESGTEASPRESTLSLRSALPTGCGGNESVHKRFERDVLFPRGLSERSIQRSQGGEAGVVDLDMFVALVSLQAQRARIPDPVMDSLGWRRGEQEEVARRSTKVEKLLSESMRGSAICFVLLPQRQFLVSAGRPGSRGTLENHCTSIVFE